MSAFEVLKEHHFDFAEAGKKPLGPVELDQKNKLKNKLTAVYYPQNSGFWDLKTNSIKADAQGSLKPSLGQLGIVYPNRTDTGRAEFIDTSGETALSEITILSVILPTGTTATDQRLYSSVNSARTDWEVLQWLDTNGGNWRIGFGASDNGGGGGSSLAFTADNTVASGKLTAIATAWKSGASVAFAKDGVLLSEPAIGSNAPDLVTHFRIHPFSFRTEGQALLGTGFFQVVWHRKLSTAELISVTKDPYQILRLATAQIYNFPSAAVTSVTTGTAVPTQTEAEVVTGGKTIILTLTGDTWVAAGTGPIGSTADTQAIIDGLTAASSPTNGWNNEVRDKEVTTAVVRTSATVCTITLTASAAYDISSTETITPTIPAAVLVTSADPVVSTPTFTVTAIAVGGDLLLTNRSIANYGGMRQ